MYTVQYNITAGISKYTLSYVKVCDCFMWWLACQSNAKRPSILCFLKRHKDFEQRFNLFRDHPHRFNEFNRVYSSLKRFNYSCFLTNRSIIMFNFKGLMWITDKGEIKLAIQWSFCTLDNFHTLPSDGRGYITDLILYSNQYQGYEESTSGKKRLTLLCNHRSLHTFHYS